MQGAPSAFPRPPPPPPPSSTATAKPRMGFYEVCMLQLVAWFLLNYWWGRQENARIKDAWWVSRSLA